MYFIESKTSKPIFMKFSGSLQISPSRDLAGICCRFRGIKNKFYFLAKQVASQ